MRVENIVNHRPRNREQIRLEADWKTKHRSNKDFNQARNCDHLMAPFECDYCIFWKLRKTFPNPDNFQDKLPLGCIRRANLDAFWIRTTSTVEGNRLQVK